MPFASACTIGFILRESHVTLLVEQGLFWLRMFDCLTSMVCTIFCRKNSFWGASCAHLLPLHTKSDSDVPFQTKTGFLTNGKDMKNEEH